MTTHDTTANALRNRAHDLERDIQSDLDELAFLAHARRGDTLARKRTLVLRQRLDASMAEHARLTACMARRD